MSSTQYIVLKRTPYRESSLLLSGISPDSGKLDLVAHGAQKISGQQFPITDLYRTLTVEYDCPQKSELGTLRRTELDEDFSALAQQPKHFILAGRIGRFLLCNSRPGMPLPFTFDSLRSVLAQLSLPPDAADRWNMTQCSVVLKCTYLYENGLLPEAPNDRQGEFLEKLVASGVENAPLPPCPDSYWGALNRWLNTLLDFHRLVR